MRSIAARLDDGWQRAADPVWLEGWVEREFELPGGCTRLVIMGEGPPLVLVPPLPGFKEAFVACALRRSAGGARGAALPARATRAGLRGAARRARRLGVRSALRPARARAGAPQRAARAGGHGARARAARVPPRRARRSAAHRVPGAGDRGRARVGRVPRCRRGAGAAHSPRAARGLARRRAPPPALESRMARGHPDRVARAMSALIRIAGLAERRFAWLLAGAIAALVALAWCHRFVQDDAFIAFRYADHLARGHGLVFNPDERVEG